MKTKTTSDGSLTGSDELFPAVFVFKTGIESHQQNEVCSTLATTPGIQRCTVDTDDCDRVLRVESTGATEAQILQTVASLGHFIEIMPD